MTDLDKARNALSDVSAYTQLIEDLIDAKVNAILDAREEKNEPDPRDARIAELEREHTWLIECDGRAYVRAERADDRADDFERKYDALLTTWNESRERHLAAEAALAELRTALAAAEYQPGDCPIIPVKIAAFMDKARALLSPEGEAKGESQPARDADPVPATERPQHWASVAVDGEKVLTIETDCADNLRAFIGTGEPNTFDPVGEDYEERVNALCEKHGCEPGSDRLAWLDERLAAARSAGITAQGGPE